jgi:imidazolonepropionase-like amidohydrolase
MTRAVRIDNAIIFDGEDMLRDERRSILIENGEIVRIDRSEPSSSDEVDVIDINGMTVMPGLIDAHFHCNSPSLNVAAADRMSASHMAQYARRYMEESLLRGFTTLRDAGGADTGLKQALAEGLIRGPRLFTSGLALSQTGGHGDIRDGGVPSCGCAGYSGSLSQVVDGADEMRRAVRDELRRGADQIKLFVSGGVLSPTDPIWMEQFTDDEIRAAVEEAERRRTYVMAHALTTRSVRRCAELGVRSIEHGLQMDRETADFVAGSASYVVATLLIVTTLASGRLTLPPGALEKAKRVAEQAVQAVEHGLAAGVRMGFGTDLLGELHGSELEELVVRSGICGPLHTLRAATSVNAEILNRKGVLGCVRPGARADLLVVDGDPLNDIAILARPAEHLKLIVKDGSVVADNRAAAAG